MNKERKISPPPRNTEPLRGNFFTRAWASWFEEIHAFIQSIVSTHVSETGSEVHGLGTISTHDEDEYATTIEFNELAAIPKSSRVVTNFAQLEQYVTELDGACGDVDIAGKIELPYFYTIPENVNIRFFSMCGYFSGSGQLLTFEKMFTALPDHKIFEDGLSVTGLEYAYVEWCGALGDGATDDSAAINRTFYLAYQVRLMAKTYACANTVIMLSGISRSFEGVGKSLSQLLWTGADGGTLFRQRGNILSTIEKIWFNGGNTHASPEAEKHGADICYDMPGYTAPTYTCSIIEGSDVVTIVDVGGTTWGLDDGVTLGGAVTGTGIPSGASMVEILSLTEVKISAAATATSGSARIQFIVDTATQHDNKINYCRIDNTRAVETANALRLADTEYVAEGRLQASTQCDGIVFNGCFIVNSYRTVRIGGNVTFNIRFDNCIFSPYNGNSFFKTGAITDGDPVLLIADTSRIKVGMKVSGTGIPSGALVESLVENTSVTLDQDASENGSAQIIQFTEGINAESSIEVLARSANIQLNNCQFLSGAEAAVNIRCPTLAHIVRDNISGGVFITGGQTEISGRLFYGADDTSFLSTAPLTISDFYLGFANSPISRYFEINYSTGIGTTTDENGTFLLHYGMSLIATGIPVGAIVDSITDDFTFVTDKIIADKTGDTTDGSAVVTGIGDTSALVVGMISTGSGIQAGTIINSIDSTTQITLSLPATATDTTTMGFSFSGTIGFTHSAILYKQHGAVELRNGQYSCQEALGAAFNFSPPGTAGVNGGVITAISGVYEGVTFLVSGGATLNRIDPDGNLSFLNGKFEISKYGNTTFLGTQNIFSGDMFIGGEIQLDNNEPIKSKKVDGTSIEVFNYNNSDTLDIGKGSVAGTNIYGTNGVRRIAIDNSGQVSVGAADPAAKLDVRETNGAEIVAGRTNNVAAESAPGKFTVRSPNEIGEAKVWSELATVVDIPTTGVESARVVVRTITDGSLIEGAIIRGKSLTLLSDSHLAVGENFVVRSRKDKLPPSMRQITNQDNAVTPDFVIAFQTISGDATKAAFASIEQARTFGAVVANLEARLNELEDRLGNCSGHGLIESCIKLLLETEDDFLLETGDLLLQE